MNQRLPRNKKELKPIRSTLRHRMPAPEVILWQKIRNNQLGIRFRRQYSIENYILDFCSPSSGLAIEIDGASHYYFNNQSKLRDKIRDEILAKQGIKVLRFTNRDVMENLEGALAKIVESTPSHSPPVNRRRNGREGLKRN